MIPFNKPYLTGNEIRYITDAHARGQLSGDGPYTKRCNEWLERNIGCHKALLTHSCTAALEMSALLLEIRPGDEVIMPSYTFVSTANAFVLRGGVPVFVDIREDTLNIDENQIESAITPRTKAIVPVHYAGVACELDTIKTIAGRYNVAVVEDAAQGIMSRYKGTALGRIGDLGCVSFHETKNIIAGEGGALLINRADLVERAEIIREKGTNRSKFYRGEVDKYTWVDLGSSYLPGEIVAAFLLAQMERAAEITAQRLKLWHLYHELLEQLEEEGSVRRPRVPEMCTHNAHMYYVLVRDLETRTALIRYLKAHDVHAVFHYVPLHSSPAGKRFGRCHGQLSVTNDISGRLLRLPLYYELGVGGVTYVCELLYKFFSVSFPERFSYAQVGY
ncbi:MAG: dTDP-4-amino-4,6-dideoxygalactose transaminase [bacterium]|nr:dTDP-4-amino-4,6-dideoxygalactose transaminase [bacterium]